MLILLTCAGGKILFEQTVTVPVFSETDWLSRTELWLQRNGEKTFACQHISARINLSKKVRPHMRREQHQECGRVWMFSQKWPARCINVTQVTREDSGKPPLHLDYPSNLFLLSSDKFVSLSSFFWSQLTSKHGVQSLKWWMFIIGQLCHNACEL